MIQWSTFEFLTPQDNKMDAVDLTFHWADYLVFSFALLVSAAIGIYYRVTGEKQKTNAEYLLAGKSLKPIPVALSLQASFLSAVSVLGTPVEMYMHGTMYAWVIVSYLIAFPVAAHVFVPIIHKFNITSAYEILEKRFNEWVRLAGCLTFSVMMLLYMSIALYAPALALSQVTGLSLVISIAVTGLVCTFYTALGGLKAVVWTDAIQMITVYAGIIALLVFGTLKVGGLTEVYKRSEAASRIQIIDWDVDPRARHTFWTQVIGGGVMTLTLYAANQSTIQRYIGIKKTKDVQLAIYIAMGSNVLSNALLVLLGLVAFAYYAFGDPLTSGQVSKADQIVPLFVMTILGPYPGLAGLFVSCTFSAALSTVSSGVNSLAAVMLEDVIKMVYKKRGKGQMKEEVATLISKVLAVVFGLLTIGLGFAASAMGPKVLQIALSIFGVVGGPLLGLFILAIFCPWANAYGAIFGLVTSLALCFWMQIGAIFTLPPPTPLPLNISHCMNLTDDISNGVHQYNGANYSIEAMTFSTNIVTSLSEERSPLTDLYEVSYMWYSVVGTLAAVVGGLLISVVTGCNKEKKTLWTDEALDVTICCMKRSKKKVYTLNCAEKSGSIQMKNCHDHDIIGYKMTNEKKTEILRNGTPASNGKVYPDLTKPQKF